MRRRGLGLVLLWLGLQSGALAAPHRPELENLRCDAQMNPMAIAGSRPVFTWIYGTGATAGDVESAARIVVLSGAAPLWDSGWVTEDDLRSRYDGRRSSLLSRKLAMLYFASGRVAGTL